MRGEVLLGGKKLLINFNTVCGLEEATGREILDLALDVERGAVGFRDLRKWVHVLMVDDASLEDAGIVLEEVGYEAGLRTIMNALNSFFPVAKKGKDKNPQTAE